MSTEQQDGLLEIFNIHKLTTTILNCIIGIVGLVGNVLMIRAWIKYRKLRTDFYTVFAALAVADILFIVVMVPLQIVELLILTVPFSGFCKISNYLVNVCGFTSAYLIVVSSVLRGILLTNRNTVSRPQAKHLIIVSIVLFIIAFLSTIPIYNMYGEFYGLCFEDMTIDRLSETWLLHSFSTLVPLCLVFIIYLLTYLLGKRFFADSYSLREKEKSKLVTLMIIAYAVFQIPYRVMDIYHLYKVVGGLNFDEDFEETEKLFEIRGYLTCVLMVDKAVRPVLYSKLASDLSQAFDEVINCRICSKSYTVPPILVSRHSQRFAPTNIVATIDDMGGDSGFSSNNGPLVDRTISTTSTSSSTTSQTPLTNQSDDTEIEMI